MQTQRRSGLIRNAFHLGIGQIVTTILTMVVSAAIARTLGAEEFGLLYVLTTIGAFAYVFVDWGHGPYVTGEIARHPERSGEMLGTVLVVRTATATLMCALAVLFTWVLGYDTRTRVLTGFIVVALFPQYLALTYLWVFRGRERMDYDAIVQIVLKFSTLILALACLALGGRLLALIPVSAVAGAITFGVAVILYRRLDLPALRVSRTTARELIHGGAPMLAIAVAVAVQPYIDANLLYKLAPTEVVGWYGAAWVIAGTLVAPASVLGATMYPRLSRVSDDPAEFGRTLRTAFRPLLLVAVLGGVGAFLFADFAVGVIYSERKFGPAADILRSFAPALVLIYIDMLFGYAIVACGKAGRLAKAKVIAVLVTTGAELILIPFCQARFANGGIGIMLGVALGELVMVGSAMLLIRDVVQRSMIADLARALVAGGATIALLRALPEVTAFIGIPVCIVAFAAFAAVVGLVTGADLDILRTMLRRRPAVAPSYPQSTDTVAIEGQ